MMKENILCLLAVCLFTTTVYTLLTYLSVYPLSNIISHSTNLQHTDYDYTNSTEIKKKIQNEFFDSIKILQSNCSNDRILIHYLFGDGFANIVHFVGQSLLISLATNRRFYIIGHFRYFRDCQNYSINNNWYCIHMPITQCKLNITNITPPNMSESFRIHANFFKYYYGNDNKIAYVDKISWYGPKPLHFTASMSMFKTGLFNQKWMHLFDGNIFWIRSHIQHYLWIFNNYAKQMIQEKPLIQMFNSFKQKGGKYIAFHIRKTDNIAVIEKDFGIDVNKIFQLKYYMNIANHIRNSNNDSLWTIYVCTDNNDIIDEIIEIENNKTGIYKNWDIIYNPYGERSTESAAYDWFFNHLLNIDSIAIWNIIMDIELLHNADYLVGPSTSNVFRLATELHYANNWIKYSFDTTKQMQTVYSVDSIPWYH